MIKKLMMLCVAAMAATGFAEIWAPGASEIQFEGVKLPDGTSSGLLVAGSNAVAKVKLEHFSPGWRVFDEEYNEYTGLRAQRHVIEKIILIGYPGAVLNDLPMPKLSDYMPNGWDMEGYFEYEKQYNKAAAMFKEDLSGNIMHISPARNRIEIAFQLETIDAINSSYRIIEISDEVTLRPIKFDGSSNICSNKNWFLLPFVLPKGKGYHGEYYWTAHVVYSDYHKQANEEGDGYLWSEDIITSPNMEKEDEEGSKCLLLITNELGRVFFDKFGMDYNGAPNWFTYWKDDGACPGLKESYHKDIEHDIEICVENLNESAYGKCQGYWINNHFRARISLDLRLPAETHYPVPKGPRKVAGKEFGGPHIWGIYTAEEVVNHEVEHARLRLPYWRQYTILRGNIYKMYGADHNSEELNIMCDEEFWNYFDSDYHQPQKELEYPKFNSTIGAWELKTQEYCDELLNDQENGKYKEYGFSDKNTDTHDFARVIEDDSYKCYGDNEFVAHMAGNKATEEKRAKPENDWAFPGEQSYVPEDVKTARENHKNPQKKLSLNVAANTQEEINPIDDELTMPTITVNSLSKNIDYEGDSMSAVRYAIGFSALGIEKIGFEGVMTDKDNNVVASAFTVVSQSENSCELRFDAKDIYASRRNGPYKLSKVVVSKFIIGDSVDIAELSEFDDVEVDMPREKLSRKEAYLLKVEKETVSVEGIVLSVDVDLKTAGDCRVLATLTTTGGVRVAKANVVKKCIAGKNSIEVIFPVSDVFESMQNGPYNVNSIELFKDGVRMDAYTDFYNLKKLYKYESFDYDEDTEDFNSAEFISQFEDYVPVQEKYPEPFLVFFIPIGGESSGVIKEYAKDEVLGELPVPTKSNAEFLGWYTATNGGERVSSSTRVTADALYFAHWSNNDPVKISYTVTFDANGGVVSPLTHSVEHNMAIGNLPTPTRSRYRFLGWYTAPEGGTKVAVTTKVTGDVTYYAQWVYDGLATVSVVVADGCEAMGKVTGGKTAKIGTKVTLTATANSGYVFSHWEGPLGDGIDSRNPSISFVVGEDDVEFVARFIPEQVKVNFHPNEGFSSEIIRNIAKGGIIGSLPVPVRSGYAFIGWYTAKAGGTKVTAATKVSSNVTYYARWEILSFKLVLHKNDGTGTSKEISVKYGSPVVLPGVVKTLKWAPRRGFSFMGWATSEKSKNVFLKDQAKVTTSLSSKDTLHVYAIWQLKTASSYAIQYIRNDGSGSVRTIGFNGGVATKLNSVKALGFERRGYTFVGWATSTADARNKKVWKKDMGVVSQPVANGKLLQIYAIWKLTPGYYSIRFNKNDGSGKWRELGYKYGDNTTLPTIANGLQWSRAGYKFGGWATSAANAAKGIAWRGDKGVTRTPVAAGKTLNVYAIWKKTGEASVNEPDMFAAAPTSLLYFDADAPARPLPGYYFGELADGTGTYDLLVDEGGETGYVHIFFDDGSAVFGEVEVDFLGDIILATDEADERYQLMR